MIRDAFFLGRCAGATVDFSFLQRQWLAYLPTYLLCGHINNGLSRNERGARRYLRNLSL